MTARKQRFHDAFDRLAAVLLDCEQAAKGLGMVQQPYENRWDALFRFRYKMLCGKGHPDPCWKVDLKTQTLQLIIMKQAHRKFARHPFQRLRRIPGG